MRLGNRKDSMKNEKSILQQTPVSSRPYERCLESGPEALSDVELLAVLLRTGTKDTDVIALSTELLKGNYLYDGISTLLHRSYEDYLSVKGIGKVKAIQLLCIGELCKRMWRHEMSSSVVSMTSPSMVAGYYRQELRFLEREQVKVVFVDQRRRLIRDVTMTTGTINSSLFNIREILIEAFRHRAVGIILLHNHPAGTPDPSEDDVEVTQKMEEAADVVGLRLYDHIIIGESGYYSFRERKMIHG